MEVDMDVEKLLIMGDSDLIIRQVQGEWETRDIKLIHTSNMWTTLANGSSVSNSEPHVQPWYHDIKRFLKTKECPEQDSGDQKRTIRRLASSFFFSGEVLYKRTPDLNLLRCVDAREAETIMNKVHSGIHGDLIHAPPLELYPMLAPWPFVAWGMDVIGPIQPKASNGHRFILVAIDYFTKWVKAVTFKATTKKAVVDFVHSNIICRFGIPKTIITDNATNLNSHLMREIGEQFKITHRNSTPYRPKANCVVEAANKNIKKILKKMIQCSRQWHEELPFALISHNCVNISWGYSLLIGL
ncbi:uncharacterized protein [Nicotiana tomentosiformis]|uniref:uncharacterized protein n=1 Tax=Nicotiana tomentosiformis TaxID=4098 RepID=UPI00388C4AAF